MICSPSNVGFSESLCSSTESPVTRHVVFSPFHGFNITSFKQFARHLHLFSSGPSKVLGHGLKFSFALPCFATLSKNPHTCRALMSLGDDTVPVDEEYHREEYREKRVMGSKQPAPNLVNSSTAIT